MIITRKQIIHLKTFRTITIMFIFISFAFPLIFSLGNMLFVELRHMFILVALTHNITKISFIVPVYNFYVIYVIQLLYVCTYCSLTGYVFTAIFRQSLFLLYLLSNQLSFDTTKQINLRKNVSPMKEILHQPEIT